MSEYTLVFDETQMCTILEQIRSPLYLVRHTDYPQPGLLILHNDMNLAGVLEEEKLACYAQLPPMYPEWLGDQQFLQAHKLRFPYIVGEMANGIATAEMVIAATQAGLMGSFGAAGLMPDVIEGNLHKIYDALGTYDGWGANLIHSPNEPAIEEATVDLFLQFGVRRVSSSAYMKLSPHIVRYAFSGVRTDAENNIIRQNAVIAKISRPEVAAHFLSPPPLEMLNELVRQEKLTQSEAQLAEKLPVATDITVESDSGGHTDNQHMPALFPIIKQQSLQYAAEYHQPVPVRIGAAGGLGTPAALAAAFSMGAAYVLTGTVNQAALEAGVCVDAKELLAKADLADIEMAPAADMFELGVELQVLKRGTLFSRRAKKLYQYYVNYPDIESIPTQDLQALEKNVFRQPITQVWQQTYDFFQKRDPQQIQLAEKDSKYKMALIFRSYLGMSSRWAIQGDDSRQLDYQLWCGPTMGAFNRWVVGSFLEQLSNRTVQQIAYNLLEGAAVISRAHQVRSAGVAIPEQAFFFSPRRLC